MKRRDDLTSTMASTVAGLLGDWDPTTHSRDAETQLESLWQRFVGHGLTELADEGALAALIAVETELGRAACPLPVTDAYVTTLLLGPGHGLRPALVREGSSHQYVEAAWLAEHVVTLGADDSVDVAPITDRTPTPGLAVPSWCDVQAAAGHLRTVDGAARRDAIVVCRLAWSARALAAATRANELAIAHAQERRAFGRRIGSFQAVSHRAADSTVALRGARLLVDAAVRAIGTTDWPLAAELAVSLIDQCVPDALFAAHHTLAAQGYFEEHPAPWLFRRAHGDLARVRMFDGLVDTVAMQLAAGSRVPAFGLGERAEAFRTEVREFIAPFVDDRPYGGVGAEVEGFTDALHARGYLSMTWPEEHGGRRATAAERAVLMEELAYHRLPLESLAAADMFGPALLRHGTAEQREQILPIVAAGRLDFYLGYSEPEIGSDLAALRTRATRDGDDWVVEGEKSWGTNAQKARWVWLAARTDPDAPPHEGITVFLTRVDRPGWSAHPHVALSGEISCTTRFDGFRIPDSDRVGEVGQGWQVITGALVQERLLMAGNVAAILRLLEDLVAAVGTITPGSAQELTISRLAARVQAGRALTAAAITADQEDALAAPMAKLYASLLLEEIGAQSMATLGPAAALGAGVPGVPGSGALEYALRLSIMHAVGGGTVDIQRNLVARGLGLGGRD